MKKLIIFITALSSFLSLNASFSSPEEMGSEGSVSIAKYKALEFRLSQVEGSEKFYRDQAAQMQRSLKSTGDILLGVQAQHEELKSKHSALLLEVKSDRAAFAEMLILLNEANERSSTSLLKSEAERKKLEQNVKVLMQKNQILLEFSTHHFKKIKAQLSEVAKSTVISNGDHGMISLPDDDPIPSITPNT